MPIHKGNEERIANDLEGFLNDMEYGITSKEDTLVEMHDYVCALINKAYEIGTRDASSKE